MPTTSYYAHKWYTNLVPKNSYLPLCDYKDPAITATLFTGHLHANDHDRMSNLPKHSHSSTFSSTVNLLLNHYHYYHFLASYLDTPLYMYTEYNYYNQNVHLSTIPLSLTSSLRLFYLTLLPAPPQAISWSRHGWHTQVDPRGPSRLESRTVDFSSVRKLRIA